ncbi:hypothetical protein O6H91_14G031000 [Diphasiastrum complanatum]|uniref:Uncharacterized protein n=2 Tax=Diphasiastrum complanatum TaxID=34168 RepID=A0ACC2BMS5_DIPCM|nr:hypothetical protein O6H91_14G031000 [Diphasiastrum complanatum]KAJ7531061.1 hypothetical protein O6H91_14G031000 [Diphasiastrum complanatum]
METAGVCSILSALILLMALALDATATTNFCSRALARKACPTPPTFDSIDIESYLGKWYGIGTTAIFRFRNEIGAVCAQANYSIAGGSTAGQGLNISLINSDLRVIGPSSSLGVSLISGVASQVCSSARKTCSLVAVDSQLQNAADQLTKVAGTIQSRHFFAKVAGTIQSRHFKEASVLNTTAHQILTTLSDIQSGLDFLARTITEIQTVNSHLSQANGSTASSVVRLRELVRKATAELSSLEVVVINLTIAPPQDLQLMVNSLLNDGDTTSVSQIFQASFWIDEGKVAVLSNLEFIRLSLDGLVNNVPFLFSLDQITNNPAPSHLSYVRGNAIQNISSAAKLEVIIDGFSGPYWILDLVGQAKDGYAASLVYGCTENERDNITENLFIISRTSKLSQDIINQLMQVAENNGINTDCDDPFLYTVQLGGDCGNPPVTA